jgi:hypothetical protein
LQQQLRQTSFVFYIGGGEPRPCHAKYSKHELLTEEFALHENFAATTQKSLPAAQAAHAAKAPSLDQH